MGMVMRFTDTDNEVGKAMATIAVDAAVAAEGATKELAKATKRAVERRLSAVRYNPVGKDGSPGKRQREIHMADDVKINTSKDRFGYPVTKVQGGRKTGTLWHIVNDGNYGKTGNHFMDKAMSDVETEIDSIIDTAMVKAGF